MNVIEETLLTTSLVFKNEDSLSKEYIPEKFLGREDIVAQLAQNFRPLFSGWRRHSDYSANLLVVSETGSATSSLIKYTLRHLQNVAEDTDRNIRTYSQ